MFEVKSRYLRYKTLLLSNYLSLFYNYLSLFHNRLFIQSHKFNFHDSLFYSKSVLTHIVFVIPNYGIWTALQNLRQLQTAPHQYHFVAHGRILH